MPLKEAMELDALYSSSPLGVTPVSELSWRLQELIEGMSAGELAALFNEHVAGTPLAHLPGNKPFSAVVVIANDRFQRRLRAHACSQ